MTSPITGLLQARLAADPAAPLITYYDDATGERTELSATTLSNWVMKTANLLQEGLDVEPGQRVAVLLEPHWQAAAILLGAWAVGATVTEALPCHVLVVPERRMSEFPEDKRLTHVLGLSLHPLGGRLGAHDARTTDYADVLLYGDHFTPYLPVDPHAVALHAGSLALTAHSVTDAAVELAARMRLGEEDRLLVDAEAAAVSGPLPWLLAPLAAGASIVLCRNADPAALPHRAETERVTVSLGIHVEGLRQAGS